jgi:Arc/MetJ-type ribon-helix-helix transcriptional regulator
MKLSVSLPGEDVQYLDEYARTQGLRSRSAVLHRAVRALLATELGSSYEDAWDAWESTGEAAAWEATAGDGLAL